jgi:hypothetical protein
VFGVRSGAFGEAEPIKPDGLFATPEKVELFLKLMFYDRDF